MLKEFVDSIGELAKRSASAKTKVDFQRLDGQAPHKIMKITADGTTEELTLDPAPRKHTLESVAEIGPFVRYALDRLHARPSVWMSPGKVTIILQDDPDSMRLDTAVVGLRHTKQFETLVKWEEAPERFTHVQFLRMLRRKFSTNILNLKDLLAILKRVTQEDGKTITSDAGRSRASIGASIVKELKLDTGEIPETVPSMTVIPYDDAAFGLPVNITCMLDIDEEGHFAVVPLAGQCKGIVDVTMIALRELIEKEIPPEVPVIYGTP